MVSHPTGLSVQVEQSSVKHLLNFGHREEECVYPASSWPPPAPGPSPARRGMAALGESNKRKKM